MWYKNPKLWTAVISQVITIISAVVLFAAPPEPVRQLVSAILASVGQIAALILTAIWGAEVGQARASLK